MRFWRALLWLLVAMVVLGLGAWFLLLRPVPQKATNDPAELFHHGSIGNEAAQGLPYWIWRVLPKVFPDLMPGNRDGYGAFGLYWAAGDAVPIGMSVKTLGVIPRVAPNCAFCHQGSYRLAPEDAPRLVSAGAGTRVDTQSYIRFVTRAGSDPRFTADRLMTEIRAIYDMPLWERMTYRFVLIPATRKALTKQAPQFAWMATRPDWGPGRIDPFNPVKFQNLRLGDDGTIGNSDMMPLWDMASTEATPLRRAALHWDGLQTDLTETVVSGAIGDGMSYQSFPETKPALEGMEAFISRMKPPPSPFSADRPRGDPYRVDPAQVETGRGIYLRDCAECHDAGGARTRSVIPVAELGTDRHRIDMWTEAARARYAAYEPGHDWGFEHFEKTEGYVAVPLTGLWLRGPYLHNGSVPTLAALLAPPDRRPKVFWRGSDLVDAANGGFVSSEGTDPRRRMWRYDTAEPGNANGGHLWGTELDPASKAALLAYLKTL
ncbi:cytochrome c [Amaricoccus solimangrovi]|uniref:Cytochrome c n=1 Tax=Amaricoccus solimangrovi TaxID=2589815 RepID=A0A501WM48_9RHOB|nr:cytochrome c [Amaricoccus solimangrovi]TPE49244.1 cytochrome c [Amaricoccus solimangrovi]